MTIPVAPPLEGLDLNRNWPADWAPEAEQLGAGPFPTSEPEVRALVEAIVARRNITSYIGYHTFSGVHLRPWSGHPDDDFPVPDLRAFNLMGEEATRLTGYPAISIFHDFKYHPKQVIKGGDVDWIYDHLGAYAWVTEFWSPQRRAGISDYHFIEWLREHSAEDELAVLKVADELGEGYVDWYPFEHPQLGPVEIGGWDLVRFWFNPPLSQLEAEVKPHADFAVHLALVSPLLEIRSFDAEPVAEGAYRLRLVLENAGWLPTNVTEKALERKAVRPIEVELELPDGARIATGKEREEAGQLGGTRRAAAGDVVGDRSFDGRADEGRVGRRGTRRRERRSGRPARARRHRSRRPRSVAMRALVLDAPRTPLRATELPDPVAAPGQILLRVRACGVCRTDLHIVDGELDAPGAPARARTSDRRRGRSGGDHFEPGSRVGVPWLGWTCGECRFCLAGTENLCDRARFTGYDVDGGYAELAVADERFCFPIPESYADDKAAPLLCAGLIGFRSLRLAGDAERIGLYGFGASAHIVCQVAVAQGRSVYAGTRAGDDETQEFARSLGATWSGDAAAGPPEELDAVIVFAPAGELVPAALRHIRKGGVDRVRRDPHERHPHVPVRARSGASASSARSRTSHVPTARSFSRSRRRFPCAPRSRRSRSRMRTRRSTVSAAVPSGARRSW